MRKLKQQQAPGKRLRRCSWQTRVPSSRQAADELRFRRLRALSSPPHVGSWRAMTPQRGQLGSRLWGIMGEVC